MDNDTTRALWEQGEDAWNAWALEALKRKEALEQAGDWTTDWFGEGQNEETQAWLTEARADFESLEFASDASFENFVFPGPASFQGSHFLGRADFSGVHFAHTVRFVGTHFDGDAVFKQAKFYHLADFEDASFASAGEFEKAEFIRDSTGPLVPAVRFQKARFAKRADFRGVKFAGHAEFVRTHFAGGARYDEAEFQAEANFEGALFEGTVGLLKTRFVNAAKFNQTQFRGEARFPEAEFLKSVTFEDATFETKAQFRLARFGGEAGFQKARFGDDVRFNEAQFGDTITFDEARFSGKADFDRCGFAAAAHFGGARFHGDAVFNLVTFEQEATFTAARFRDSVSFDETAFSADAKFDQANFKSRASFRQAVFSGTADFTAIQARSAFVLAGARFSQVPSFLVASLAEPPRFDHMMVADPMRLSPQWADKALGDPRPHLLRRMKVCGDADYSARYRRLRQLAVQTQDNERVQWFFAQEVRCRRFWRDKPFGPGKAKFWIGWAYGGISNFGRSMLRPLGLWVLLNLIFTVFYLSARQASYFTSAPGPVTKGVPLFPVWPEQGGFWGTVQFLSSVLWWLVDSILNVFAGGGCIAGDGRATGEAFFLSLKNSLFFLGWESPDAARRVYSCLYGFEQAGSQLVRVPLGVSTMAILQNAIGVVLIALFVLAARNMLRAR